MSTTIGKQAELAPWKSKQNAYLFDETDHHATIVPMQVECDCPGLGEMNSASKWRPNGPAIRFGSKNQMPARVERWSCKNRTTGPLDLHGAAAVLRSQAVRLGWANGWSFGPKTVATHNWLIDFCRTNAPTIRLGWENQVPAMFELAILSWHCAS